MFSCCCPFYKMKIPIHVCSCSIALIVYVPSPNKSYPWVPNTHYPILFENSVKSKFLLLLAEYRVRKSSTIYQTTYLAITLKTLIWRKKFICILLYKSWSFLVLISTHHSHCDTVWKSTIKRNHAQKIPWNHLFINFDLTEKMVICPWKLCTVW